MPLAILTQISCRSNILFATTRVPIIWCIAPLPHHSNLVARLTKLIAMDNALGQPSPHIIVRVPRFVVWTAKWIAQGFAVDRVVGMLVEFVMAKTRLESLVQQAL